jgi:branched-chain amino acid transport system permease protein
MAMLFVGGSRGVTGAVAGVIIITVGKEIFRWVGDGPTVFGAALPQLPGLTDIFLGLVITGSMVFRSRGLFGDVEADDLLARRLARRWTGAAHRAPDHRAPDHGAEHSADHNVDHTPGAPGGVAPGTSGAPGASTLRAIHVRRSFGGLNAVDDADLTITSGRVVGLIGPNGSGKTTMLNLLSGVLAPTSGDIRLDGAALGSTAFHVGRRGVGRTFQNVRLFDSLSARLNIAVAYIAAGRHRDANADAWVAAIVTRLELTDVLERPAKTLPYGIRRKLEIARAAALLPRFILLDEPVAGMNEVESAEIAGVVRDLAAVQGCGVLVLDHDLPFILGICDEIYVMENGRVIAHGTPDEIRTNEHVLEAYLGAS